LNAAQDRGQLFLNPGVEVYEGMVVGQHIRERDLEVNVVRKKHLTNMRSSNSDIAAKLDGIRELSLDDAVESSRTTSSLRSLRRLPHPQALADQAGSRPRDRSDEARGWGRVVMALLLLLRLPS